MVEPRILYSAVIPVGSRVDDVKALIVEYAEELFEAGFRFEVIVVLDGLKPELCEQLSDLAGSSEWLRIIQFSRQFGESAALMAGFNESRGDFIITLPAYWQVKAPEISKLINSAEQDDDMLIGVRWPRAGSVFERLRRATFHGMLKWITGVSYRDLGCGVRFMTRSVLEEVYLYGDHYRFLPLLAARRGFQVREVELAQSPNDRFRGRYRLREYLHGFLNVMTIFFLVRFTKKPLRFFGSVGFFAAMFGSIGVAVLVTQRLVFGVALADRPALLLASLLIVLGVQLFALGLLGELVIFSHAAESKEYAIRSIIGLASDNTNDEDEPAAEEREITVHW